MLWQQQSDISIIFEGIIDDESNCNISIKSFIHEDKKGVSIIYNAVTLPEMQIKALCTATN